MANPNNRYNTSYNVRTKYTQHINNIPWSTCPCCGGVFHLYATIGESKYFSKEIRDKKLSKILS